MHDAPISQTVAPVVKTVLVPLPPEAAFRLFTDEAARWWPLPTHSVFGDDAATCRMEGRVGGRFYEVHRDGLQQSEWGRVLSWEPPQRFAFSFYPGREPSTAQQVQVIFQPEAGGTRVTLTHTGWEALGDRSEKICAPGTTRAGKSSCSVSWTPRRPIESKRL
jgi:uncharacterized protein YndB with AHSA1/START domain